ncbi:hypothetical protein I302_100460 [Kwoniella bestiolae CBS 10118]|uniref:Uncharacterized protein n=1 Tax=Kwoniella bestiolae CBS 10118 TaxID=1296100 RepID=A0A1B9G561_9TREE|nr:hypothetical protein I302_03834 [Kwoniella bestiolae CBS 10118]OCF26156.1 hypothetical protein I302_03834 [Kwoniella bestiolae CBS 10118]
MTSPDVKTITYKYPLKALVEHPPPGHAPPAPFLHRLFPGSSSGSSPSSSSTEIVIQTRQMVQGDKRLTITTLTVPSSILITPIRVDKHKHKHKDKDDNESMIEIFPYPLSNCSPDLIKRSPSDYISTLLLDDRRTEKGFSMRLVDGGSDGEFRLNERFRSLGRGHPNEPLREVDWDEVVGLGRGCTEIVFRREPGDVFEGIEVGLDLREEEAWFDGNGNKAEHHENGMHPAEEEHLQRKRMRISFSTPKERERGIPKMGKILISYRFMSNSDK